MKRVEHLWKGLSNDSGQISAIPPEGYGTRFLNFMTGISMTKEEADRRRHDELPPKPPVEAGVRAQQRGDGIVFLDGATRSSHDSGEKAPRSPAVEKTMERAQKHTEKSEKRRSRSRSNSDEPPDRILGTLNSPSVEKITGNTGTTLPVVEEAGEAGSTGGRSGRSGKIGPPIGEEHREPKEKGRSCQQNDAVGIRHVLPSEHPPEEDSGSPGLPEIPRLSPLTASPPSIDPQKGIVDGNATELRPDAGYTS